MDKFRKYAPLLIAFFLVVNILLVGLIVSGTKLSGIKNAADLPLIVATTTPVATSTKPTPQVERTVTTLGKRISGSIEEIDLLAAPLTAKDSLAMVRLYIENGEVLDFSSSGFIALGSCADNKKFTVDHVCVDIAKSGPFTVGEKLGTVKIKWGNNGLIYREAGDGYYNGQQTTLNVPSGQVISDSGVDTLGQVAGITTTADGSISLAGYILIFIGATLVFVALIGVYLNVTRSKKPQSLDNYNKSDRNIKILLSISMIVLTGGVVFAATMIANNQQAPTNTNALSVSPIYITVIATQKVTQSPVPTKSPTPTLTSTPLATLSVTPSITLTTNPTPTATVTPTYFMPTPVTDNIAMVCGPIDVNGDRMLNYIDLQGMMVVYNHSCTDTYPHISCGGKDTNYDGKVDYRDAYYLITHYYPNTLDCSRY